MGCTARFDEIEIGFCLMYCMEKKFQKILKKNKKWSAPRASRAAHLIFLELSGISLDFFVGILLFRQLVAFISIRFRSSI